MGGMGAIGMGGMGTHSMGMANMGNMSPQMAEMGGMVRGITTVIAVMHVALVHATSVHRLMVFCCAWQSGMSGYGGMGGMGQGQGMGSMVRTALNATLLASARLNNEVCNEGCFMPLAGLSQSCLPLRVTWVATKASVAAVAVWAAMAACRAR